MLPLLTDNLGPFSFLTYLWILRYPAPRVDRRFKDLDKIELGPIEMTADGLDAPLLNVGRKVKILFYGIPAIPLPAWPELMAGTFDGRIQVVDQSASANGKFRFWVIPDSERRSWPPQDRVRQGTQVMGWVILNRVPLWYEIWRRFNLFPADYESGEPRLTDVLLPKAGRPVK